MSRREHARFQEHLRECEHCEVYLHQVRATVAAAGRLPEAPADPHTRAALLRAFRELRAKT
jgi:hypothetical protein